MTPKKSSELHVIIGLGKTGLSCVQRLTQEGYNLAVIDSRNTPPNLDEFRQNFPQIPLFLGNLDSDLLDQATEIILSPGISKNEPAIAAQAKRGIPIIGDIELFVRRATAPIVAITGTNGKSTVTSLVGEMAHQAGLKVQVGGNLGIPALDLLNPKIELYVLELSSFQLETTFSLKAAAATILNIAPDHLDRYPNIAEYFAAKYRIYSGAKVAVINRDDPESYAKVELPSRVISFGLGIPDGDNFGCDGQYINHGNKKLLLINELKIKGLHQVANALAALALGTAINLPETAMLSALCAFPGLPHRCQWVVNIDGVDWYNDSKGTNVGSTIAAIAGLGATVKGKLILIAGGLGKNADFAPLQNPVKKYVRTVILIGKDAAKIAQAIANQSKIIFADSMQHAIDLAKQEAQNNDAVLLSPACASYDMFKNFEDRGEIFMRQVLKLTM